WRLTLDSFPAEIILPLPPCQAVNGISYIDPTGAAQTLPPSAYEVFSIGDAEPARIHPAFGLVFPATRARPEAVTVEFKAGYGDAAADIPEPLRAAIKLHAAHLYEHREAVAAGSFSELPHSYQDLIRDYRMWGF